MFWRKKKLGPDGTPINTWDYYVLDVQHDITAYELFVLTKHVFAWDNYALGMWVKPGWCPEVWNLLSRHYRKSTLEERVNALKNWNGP